MTAGKLSDSTTALKRQFDVCQWRRKKKY